MGRGRMRQARLWLFCGPRAHAPGVHAAWQASLEGMTASSGVQDTRASGCVGTGCLPGARQAFADYTELSISRRFEFSNTPLDEFPLTLPVTRIDETAPLLQMTQDAGVQMKSAQAVNLLRSLGRVPKWTCAKTPLVKVPVPAAE